MNSESNEFSNNDLTNSDHTLDMEFDSMTLVLGMTPWRADEIDSILRFL